MNESIRFTTTELRLITGIPAKNLNTYKLRGKIYRDNQGMWPYNNEINRAFIDLKGIPGQLEKVIAQRNGKANKVAESKKKPTKIVKKADREKKSSQKVAPKKSIKKPKKKTIEKKEVKEKVTPENEIIIPKGDKEDEEIILHPMSELARVQLEQKKLSVEKAKSESELKKIELEQKRGSLIELEKTILITKEYSDMLKRGLLEDIKLFVQDICARHDIPTGKAGEYKLKIADIINDRNSKAIKGLMKKFK